METQQIDEKKIQKMYAHNEQARTVLDLMAKRSKAAKVTTVDTIQKATGYDRANVIAMFRSLDAAGCGRFISGRQAYPSRFAWATNMVSVGKLAAKGLKKESAASPIEETETLGPPVEAQLEPERGETPQVEPAPVAASPEPEVVVHNFALRPHFNISLPLPSDVTTVEILRFTDYLHTLPFVG